MPKKAKRAARIEFYQRNAGPEGPWYWRLVASNGKTIADGSEGYASEGNVLRAARRAVDVMQGVIVIRTDA